MAVPQNIQILHSVTRLADKNPSNRYHSKLWKFLAESVKKEACLFCQAGMLEFFSQPLSVKQF